MDGILKLSFRFNFDKYEDEHPDTKNQRFYGFKKMTFSNGFKDSSLIRDKVAADLFRAAGVPAARGTFVRVYLDHGDGPVYMGLYTMIEDPSDAGKPVCR
jgi:spore coat protein CotH